MQETSNGHPNGRNPVWSDLVSRLANYKATHKQTAKNKNLEHELSLTKTLTQARCVLFGAKTKKYVGRRDELGIKGQK